MPKFTTITMFGAVAVAAAFAVSAGAPALAKTKCEVQRDLCKEKGPAPDAGQRQEHQGGLGGELFGLCGHWQTLDAKRQSRDPDVVQTPKRAINSVFAPHISKMI